MNPNPARPEQQEPELHPPGIPLNGAGKSVSKQSKSQLARTAVAIVIVVLGAAMMLNGLVSVESDYAEALIGMFILLVGTLYLKFRERP